MIFLNVNNLFLILSSNNSWVANNFILSLIIYQITFLILLIILIALFNIFPNKKIKKEFEHYIDFTKMNFDVEQTKLNMISTTFYILLFQIPYYFSQLIFETKGYAFFIFISSIICIILSILNTYIQIKFLHRSRPKDFKKIEYDELDRLKSLYKDSVYKSFKIKYKNKIDIFKIVSYQKKSRILEYKILHKESFILDQKKMNIREKS